MKDSEYMELALMLAKKWARMDGRPNPMVGGSAEGWVKSSSGVA